MYLLLINSLPAAVCNRKKSIVFGAINSLGQCAPKVEKGKVCMI